MQPTKQFVCGRSKTILSVLLLLSFLSRSPSLFGGGAFSGYADYEDYDENGELREEVNQKEFGKNDSKQPGKKIPNDEEFFCSSTYREIRQAWKEAPVEAKRIVARLKNPKLRSQNYAPYAFFYGEPGEGKSLLAKAIAVQAGYLCDFIGMGEVQAAENTKNQRNQTGINLLKRLKGIVALNYPMIVVLDEINEYLEGFENEGNDTSFTSKVLWNFLDDQMHNYNFFLIGTMNRGDKLPKPMKSRGYACAVEVKMSSDPETRTGIFKNILCSDDIKLHSNCTDEFLKEIIGVTKKYNPRDFKNIAFEAHGFWIDETDGEGEQLISKEHIIAAMCKIEKVRSDWQHDKRILSESEQNRINFLKGQAIYLACQARQRPQRSKGAQAGLMGFGGNVSLTSPSGMREDSILDILHTMFTKEDVQDLQEEYARDTIIPFNKIKDHEKIEDQEKIKDKK